ncbi:unnamed protein product [Effrenium voratum]|uniref:NADP-dependent oxidoreductase domain-containing protein n=1 Tax=Effrenium voratum TaxID=2562239 RepID=A0AA36I4A1_9DINO|nr:unnamed protein product [Effrenium voratum]CAJ1453497.1 unnamed protein product [Effrenium voratum]
MLRLVGVVAVAAAAKEGLCDKKNGSVPCAQLPHGVAMPMVALGSWRGSYKDCAGDNYTCAQEHARSALQSWLQEVGGRHLDTANDYRTQIQVGEALKASKVPREEVFITTKCPGPMGFNATLQCVEDNLQMLGLYGDKAPYIDLLLIHFPFVIKPECVGAEGPTCNPPYVDPGREARRESWAAMELALRLKKVRAIGVSNYEVGHLQEIADLAERPAVNQVEWHPFHHDDQLKAYCDANGIKVEAWSPLSGQNASALASPTVQQVAKSHNVSGAQVVLRWALQQDVSVVVGTDNKDHMKSDLQVFNFSLSDSEMAQISGLKGLKTTLHV